MKILVAADISPTTICVVEFLQKLLKQFTDTTELIVVHVYEPELDYEESAPEVSKEILPASENELKHIFQPLETICKIKYIITNEKHGDSILSRSSDVNMIVMGRRRRNQLEEVLLGSLSQYVLHRATCPVIIVPEPTARQVTQLVLKTEQAPVKSKPIISIGLISAWLIAFKRRKIKPCIRYLLAISRNCFVTFSTVSILVGLTKPSW